MLGELFTPVVELASSKAPATMVSPLMATENPNSSPDRVDAVFRYACWLHAPAARVNTYTAPAFVAPSAGVEFVPVVALSSSGAPTTTVSPLMPTDQPK